MTEFREGILKFDCQWAKADADPDWPSDSVLRLRAFLHAKNLVGVDIHGIGFGNVSARFGVGGAFIITGTQTGHLEELSANHLTLVKNFILDANQLECQGPAKASSESMSHAVVYRRCPAVNCVVHVHHQVMWGHYQGKLPTTPREAAYGTPELARAIDMLLCDQNTMDEQVIVMGGHEPGLLFFGKDAEETLQAVLRRM